jgi:hypothetical protein
MADKKISALTGATTPLAGTEVLPVVQGGSTVKVSVANLTAGRAVSASTLTSAGSVTAGVAGYTFNGTSVLASDGSANYLNTGAALYIQGNGVIYTGGGNIAPNAGKGIDFSANTHAAGMTSELLNWYEEGVFTPTLAFGGTSTGITYALQVGRYTRIGRTVSVQAYLQLSAAGAAVGVMTMEGLPFASANVTNYVSLGTCAFDNALTSQDQPIARLNSNSTSVMIMGGTGTDNWFQWTNVGILSASLRVFVSLTYTV